MNWLNLNIAVLDSHDFISAPSEERGIWFSLLCYCLREANDGRISGCRNWTDDQWRQSVNISRRHAAIVSELWEWDGDDIVVPFDPAKAYIKVKIEAARLPFSQWEPLRKRVFLRDGRACVYCGATDRVLHCDHVVAVSKGGSNDMENLVTACGPCNLSKGAKPLEKWKGGAP